MTFVTMNMTFVTMKGWFVATKQLDIAQQLPLCFFSAFSSSLCSVFTQNLQNTIKRGIIPFSSDNGVNLAFKLYKTCEKHIENVNKIHTYQRPLFLVMFPISSNLFLKIHFVPMTFSSLGLGTRSHTSFLVN